MLRRNTLKSVIPDEFKIETYERRYFTGQFERLDLAMKFRSGYGGIGAIFISWVDAISLHDVAVKEVEEKMEKVEQLKQIYDKHNRTFRHWDASWTALNIHPEDYSEYQQLLLKVENYESRIKLITDAEAKARLKLDYQRYTELHDLNSRLYQAEQKLIESRKIRDDARSDLVNAERELNESRDYERKAAAAISEDHIIADQKNVFISEIYPNIYEGYILAILNDEDVESLEYNKILKKISKAKMPTVASFRRYNYRFDFILNDWVSLEDLRAKNVYIEDPRIERAKLVQLAGEGDSTAVTVHINKGSDPNSTDYSGSSALQAAAANNHIEVVNFLHSAGALINHRDKNMMSPLLAAVQRGHVDIARALVDLGADIYASDRRRRNAVHYAITSGSKAMLEFILALPVPLKTVSASLREGNNYAVAEVHGVVGRDTDPDVWSCNQHEAVWGWTALHATANRGDIEMLKLVLAKGASIYRLSKNKMTAEDIAREAGHTDIASYLEHMRLNAPGQRIFKNPKQNSTMWIGGAEALDPWWLSETHITHILYMHHDNYQESVSSNGRLLIEAMLRIKNPTGRRSSSRRGFFDEDKECEYMSHDSSKGDHGLVDRIEGYSVDRRDDDEEENDASEKYRDLGDGITREVLVLDTYDDDNTNHSWNTFQRHIGRIHSFLTQSAEVAGAQILLCDPSGISTSPTALAIFLMLGKQISATEAVEICMKGRPKVAISHSFRRGLDKLQSLQEQKKLKRLREKVRHSTALSIAF